MDEIGQPVVVKKKPPPTANSRARKLRRASTEAEKRFWRIVSRRQVHGFKFRRQAPIGPYIVDFVCHEAGLIIEIDGGQHRSDNPTERARQSFLEQQGYRVLRFWNTDVLSNPEGIHETLQSALFEE